ncbi:MULTISPECIES: methionine biosynthesis PLP-dependent protein [Aeribacillus]|uniref:Cystathionine gamma-synthase n=1 Tax=Aeribacillus pallidus TaxID=33936 RepID=A0A165Y837_9BACI|nr:methionine biosynthesis PLP-dependent protein [Aeribacillus pallidus]KZN96823.1 cystathionine gamma-synthase [Aeribacillus pallidus]MDR9796388.1 methionine biosynthesis PLP-dependent protein [Aeribacillus pallidus]RZI50931.1 methionine biosynthesis PLP-dependent protein [Aeribacillus pallidus]BBU38806.1 cystathionine gamma-synthase/O-acetylhomoserine (thiol)-lyase [Aeribacillus pallidus]
MNIETVLAQLGNRSEALTGTVSAPIYLSTAYRHKGIGESTGYDYTRTKNPTRELVEDAIAKLEGADQGFAFSSGMAAIQTIMALFKSGDELIVSKDLYGGTYRLFEEEWRKYGLSFHYDDFTSREYTESLINENTKAIFLETPTNPLMQETSISSLAELVRKHNLLLIVDNTFYTPVLQRPIEEGAHIVIHSATKYLGGHNDVLAGLVCAKGKEICEKLAMHQNAIGAVLSPFDSWLLLRGMKTLSLRMAKHQENARELAAYLKELPEIDDVLYPGRGGMLSFRVKKEEWVNPFLQNLKLICFAESLGGVESFITYPATQTHADIPEEIRIQNGVCNRLLRFSVGIESVEDLKEDLKQALQAAAKGDLLNA